MGWIDGVVRASGLDAAERAELDALMHTYRRCRSRNAEIERYYEGEVGPRPIGADTLLSQVKLDARLSCDWPRKAVNDLANLVRFDGFVFDGDADPDLEAALRDCGFASAFARHRIGMLKNGCMFATVGTDGTRPYVRFHSANTGTAIMNPATERMRSGLVVADMGLTEWSPRTPVPTQVNLHMPGRVVELRRLSANDWSARRVETPEGVCMMVPMAYAPTDTKPLGTSRVSRPVRDLVDDVLHLREVLVLSCELYAIPMRYILGLTAETLNSLKKDPKWALYLNPVFTSTRSNKGEVPEVGQLPANSPAALLDLIYADAKMFSSATGVPLNSLGVVQDNPSSAEAIAEGRKGLTDEAEALIDGQLKPAMREVALLLMMVAGNKGGVDGLTDVQRSVGANFRDPAQASVSASTDAAMKMATVNPEFAQTRTFFRMCRMGEEEITTLMAEMRMNRARANMAPLLAQTREAATPTATAPAPGQLNLAQRSPSDGEPS